jgi:hypothetical protein
LILQDELSSAINTTIYYVIETSYAATIWPESLVFVYYIFPDFLLLFRPPGGHSQAIKTYKSKITIAAAVMGDQVEISAFGVTIYTRI